MINTLELKRIMRKKPHLITEWQLILNKQHASSKDTNWIEGSLDYYGKLQEIIQLNFRSFKCDILRCKWYKISIMHDTPNNYIAIDFIKYLSKDKEPYIFLQHYDQIYFIPYILDKKICFVIKCAPKGRHIIHSIPDIRLNDTIEKDI